MLADAVIRRQAVRELLRGVLGCECPDEVFSEIRVGVPALFATHRSPTGLELLIGGRLLLAVLRLDDLHQPLPEAQEILARGRAIRDRHGFNRFRLVLVGTPEATLRHGLMALAASLTERLHLHVISESTWNSLPHEH